jgi:sugar transferase (PEP-CTERM/EpsH1 system associated)
MGHAPPLTVLHLSWSLLTGGLERVVLDLTRLGPGFGLRPVVAALEQAGPWAELVRQMGATFHLLGKRPGLDPRMVPALVRLLRRERVDVIHAHNQAAALYGGLAGLLCGRPLVVTRHGASYGKDLSHLMLGRVGALIAKRVVCVGQEACQVARRVDHVPEARLRLIYNGVDTGLYRPDPVARARVRAELGLTPQEPAFISVGRLSAEKDYPTLLKALALLGESGPVPRLLMVGDGPERPALERATGELGLGGAVLWLGERQDVPRLLAACDAFALSSLSEGVSIAILEAMAVGLPVAATLVGGNLELVEQGRTGLLGPPADPPALAQALGQLLGDLAGARAKGQAARARAEERFSLAATAGAYAGLYREVVAEAHGNILGRRRA